jgi:uncharacterized protein (TIGR00269 family)
VAACSKCPAPAVIALRYAGTSLCREHFLEFFDRRAKAEVSGQGRLPEGTIAVALSGGKDSVSLLHFMHGLVGSHPRMRLVALTVDEGIAGYRDGALDVCRKVTTDLGVAWHVVKTRDLAGYSIDEYAAGTHGPASESHPNSARPACGPCGVFRRTGINRLAREVGAAAVVTGHNLDDMAQTILMNHLKGDLDRLARLAPHGGTPFGHPADGDIEEGGPAAPHAAASASSPPRQAPNGLVPRILPFRTIPEKEVLLYALLNGLPIHQEMDGGGECPYAQRSHRFAMRDVLVGLERATPGTRHALVKGAERLKPILQRGLTQVPVGACASCGDPTIGAICNACALRA